MGFVPARPFCTAGVKPGEQVERRYDNSAGVLIKYITHNGRLRTSYGLGEPGLVHGPGASEFNYTHRNTIYNRIL